MFERFNEQGRQVVVLAQDEARSLGHDHIGSEHLLLGLLRIDDELVELFGDPADARRRVVELVGEGELASPGQIPFTRERAGRSSMLAASESGGCDGRAMAARARAARAARRRERARALRALGVSVSEAREEILGLRALTPERDDAVGRPEQRVAARARDGRPTRRGCCHRPGASAARARPGGARAHEPGDRHRRRRRRPRAPRRTARRPRALAPACAEAGHRGARGGAAQRGRRRRRTRSRRSRSCSGCSRSRPTSSRAPRSISTRSQCGRASSAAASRRPRSACESRADRQRPARGVLRAARTGAGARARRGPAARAQPHRHRAPPARARAGRAGRCRPRARRAAHRPARRSARASSTSIPRGDSEHVAGHSPGPLPFTPRVSHIVSLAIREMAVRAGSDRGRHRRPPARDRARRGGRRGAGARAARRAARRCCGSAPSRRWAATLAAAAGRPAHAERTAARSRSPTRRRPRSDTPGSAASTCCSRSRARTAPAARALGLLAVDRGLGARRARRSRRQHRLRRARPHATAECGRSRRPRSSRATRAGAQADDGDLLLGLARESTGLARALLGPGGDRGGAPRGARTLSRREGQLRAFLTRLPQVRDTACRCPSQRTSETPEGSDILDRRTRRAPLRESSRE